MQEDIKCCGFNMLIVRQYPQMYVLLPSHAENGGSIPPGDANSLFFSKNNMLRGENLHLSTNVFHQCPTSNLCAISSGPIAMLSELDFAEWGSRKTGSFLYPEGPMSSTVMSSPGFW